jgi:hypothetical protein
MASGNIAFRRFELLSAPRIGEFEGKKPWLGNLS